MQRRIFSPPEMSRFNKVYCIFIAVGASLFVVFVLETKLRNITQWTPWNRNVLTATFGTKIRNRSLCVGFEGRLGNQMFIYASAYGIAHKKNRELIIINNRLVNIFEGISLDRDSAECERLIPYKERRSCAFDHETLEFADDNDVFLKGYLQSWMYFEDYSAAIRRIFTFKRHILFEAKSILNDIKRQYLADSGIHDGNLTVIGVHVRRGDMLKAHLRQAGYRTATRKYFFHAMDYFTRRFSNILFVVCSDDIAWSKENLLWKKNIKIAAGSFPAVDMAILSLCNHTISSIGSFSWWSAWLAGGASTYFAHPVSENSPLRKMFSKNFSDYFWPGWVPLS